MDICKTINQHIDAMHLPLYAITMTAVNRVNTPVMLMLHWHGFRRATPLSLLRLDMPSRPVPGSAIQLDERWESFLSIESAMLDAAWQLGAWDIERVTGRPYGRIGAPAGEELACRRAFGDYPDWHDGEAVLLEAPNQQELIALASRRGYVRWLFRPRKSGVWDTCDEEDSTLAAGSVRSLPCPVRPHAFDGATPRRVVYRLGCVNHLIGFDTN